MNCPTCQELVADSQRYCPACGADAGFPNVRLAQRKHEETELAARLTTASDSASASGYSHVFCDFGSAINDSQAIIARPLRVLQDLIANKQKTYSGYHKELTAGTRIPENNIFDQTRTQFENALFPNFYQEICYAALTLNDKWVDWFGDHAMILKEQMIAHRSTVFEENPYNFSIRHGLALTDTFPPGYRAVWGRRGDVAKAKLYPKLSAATTSSDYPTILLPDGSSVAEADYIEVHVYGPFTGAAIQKIIGPTPRSHEDKIIWRKLKRDAQKAGISVEEV